MKGGEAANGTSGVVEAVTAGEGSIGYADASQAGELGIAKIKVGSDYAEPSPEAAAKVLELSKEDKELEGGNKYVIRVRNRPHADRGGHLPDHPGLLADRLHRNTTRPKKRTSPRRTSNT